MVSTSNLRASLHAKSEWMKDEACNRVHVARGGVYLLINVSQTLRPGQGSLSAIGSAEEAMLLELH